MKKLLFAFTMFATAAGAAGTALADDFRGGAPVVDRRMDPAPVQIRMPDAPAYGLIAVERAFGRRGTLSIDLPRGARYEELRLQSTDRDLDILAVEINYGRGGTRVLRPTRDGVVKLDLDGRRVRSIQVRYANRGHRGGGRGAMIKVFGQTERVVYYGRDRRM